MHITKYIEELIVHVRASQAPPTFKSQVVHALEYFKQQSLCDSNRRDPEAKIKAAWYELEKILMGTSLFDRFRSETPRWSAFMNALGVEKFPHGYGAPAPAKRSRFADRTAEELMSHLARRCEDRTSFTNVERSLVCIGLYYLELEARRGRGQRNKQRIQQTWATIQPILRKIGVLNDFDGEDEAIKRIKFFISDRFL